MSIEKNSILEIGQVANGFIVRLAQGNWMLEDNGRNHWAGTTADYYVFRTFAEMQIFLVVSSQDRTQDV